MPNKADSEKVESIFGALLIDVFRTSPVPQDGRSHCQEQNQGISEVQVDETLVTSQLPQTIQLNSGNGPYSAISLRLPRQDQEAPIPAAVITQALGKD